MEIYILNNELEKIEILDDYESLIWVKRYFEFGECELYIMADIQKLQFLRKGNFIIREDDDMICRIESIRIETDEEDGDHIIVTGYDVRKILNQRIVWKQIAVKGTVELYLRKLIMENLISPEEEKRKIPFFALKEVKGWEEKIEEQTTYTVLGDKITKICQTYGYGWKASLIDKMIYIEFYKGEDRSYSQEINPHLFFSDDYENLLSTTYLESMNNSGNVALIAGEGEGNERSKSVIGNSEGINRHEIYVDARDISRTMNYKELTGTYPNGNIQKEGDTIYYIWEGQPIAILEEEEEPNTVTLLDVIYIPALEERGKETLLNYGEIIEFEGEVQENTFLYKEDYHLGDIVTIKNMYGISNDARITETMETFDQEGYHLDIKLEPRG